jgi:transcriptional regulator with XRE-family HTH domain
MSRRRLVAVNKCAARDATRTLGLHIRRIRKARDKSLRVIAGLAGMSHTTLHRVERGQRDLTLSEIVALASALQIPPTKLIDYRSAKPPDETISTASSVRRCAGSHVPYVSDLCETSRTITV